MGIVRMGAPAEMMLHLRDVCGATVFVETGTWDGNTAFWASNHFAQVITIENSPEVFQQARERFTLTPNVECIFGDSRIQLQGVLTRLSSPAFFWLDSHWCGGRSFGERDQCPLLEELRLLNATDLEHYIFIDDARLFLSPPPRPAVVAHWPTIDTICRLLTESVHHRYVVVFEDVIAVVPSHARDRLASWCQDRSTEAWSRVGVGADEPTASARPLGFTGIVSRARRLAQGASRRMRMREVSKKL
jgi:hypothetical protein